MHKLPEQNELILRLKEAYKNKGLTLNKLIDLMPEDSNKLGRSTVQRLFHGENSENKSYDYNTLIFLANLLLDVNEDDPLLVFKREVIGQLEKENKDLKLKLEEEKNSRNKKIDDIRKEYDRKISFLMNQIDLKDKRIDKLMQNNTLSADLVSKLVAKCENCKLQKGVIE